MTLKKISIWCMIALIVFSFSIFFMLLNINFIISDENYFHKEFAKYGVYDTLNGYDVDAINKDVLDFINSNEWEYLESDFFTPREISHLSDVKNLIGFGRIFLLASFGVSVLLGIILFFLDRKPFLRRIFFWLLWAGILILALNLFLVLSISLNFDFAFDKFHILFFPDGSWLFNPYVERIVVLYPEALFYDFGERIVAWDMFIGIILIIVSGGWLLMNVFRRRSKNNSARIHPREDF